MDIMQLETRSWKGNDPVTPMSTPNANYGGSKNGFRSRNGGGGFSGGRNSGGRGPGGRSSGRSNGRPGSRSGPARRGQ
jgi:ATP-dependent RNA helicase RhlE